MTVFFPLARSEDDDDILDAQSSDWNTSCITVDPRRPAVEPLSPPNRDIEMALVLATWWQLFTHQRRWLKELRNRCSLSKGEYDGAGFTRRISPDRGPLEGAGCRGLAIAQNFEDTPCVRENAHLSKWHHRYKANPTRRQVIVDQIKPTVDARSRLHS